MVVPETIAFGHARVVEPAVVPAVRFGVAVGEGKIGGLAVVVPRHMVKVIAVHVYTKLWPTNAERMDFTKKEEIRRPGNVTRFSEHAIPRVGLIVVSRTRPANECVHTVVLRTKEKQAALF